VNKFFLNLIIISILASCSNTPELETGEIKTLAILEKAFTQSNQSKQFIDARLLLSRKQIDEAKIPILFAELPSTQNGTLTPYPGQGIGQTWLGADGATINLDRGVLKASRGMGDDLMGSTLSMPNWTKINFKAQTYIRELSYITGNNKILTHTLTCNIQKTSEKENIKVWNVDFSVDQIEETCFNDNLSFKNTYHVDNRDIVRRSTQYHSNTIGYIFMERLDR
jgi:hypothetical protein